MNGDRGSKPLEIDAFPFLRSDVQGTKVHELIHRGILSTNIGT